MLLASLAGRTRLGNTDAPTLKKCGAALQRARTRKKFEEGVPIALPRSSSH
jgi:hypothetical protein